MRKIEFWSAVLLAVLICGLPPGRAADWPSSLLQEGDQAVLVAPSASFSGELARMQLEPSKFQAATNPATPAEQTLDSDLRDLAECLKKDETPEAEAARILAGHRGEREKLKSYLEAVAIAPAVPPLEFPRIITTRGLPDEFADFFEGELAWHNPALTNKTAAREAWRNLLNRPAAARHYKSTWAAFMLGSSFQKEDPARAVAYFKRVRDLSEHGFADSAGLAASSLGQEAQIDLQQGKFSEAIELYLEQFASGDRSASESLRLNAAAAVNQEDARGLAALAADSKVRRVITTYLVSANDSRGNDASKKWLEAAESAGAQDASSAQEFALAAYQAGDWAAAQRWIDRAPAQPVNQWLQGKLLLRAGKLEEAAAQLAQLAALFPIQSPATNAILQFMEDLAVVRVNQESTSRDHDRIPATNQILGELGVLRLSLRDYVAALDALWRAGFMLDGSYIASRVLTVDELKNYVDRHWPDGTDSEIRNLLAQRLAREGRAAAARGYYDPQAAPDAASLAEQLAQSTNESLPAAGRARALFAAAKITAEKGVELLGENLDYSSHLDKMPARPLWQRTNAALTRPSEDELRRVAQSAPEPDVPYFHKFKAAALGWQAAQLMPDNSDETARVLCEAGSWIKYLDPAKADVFYKALVRRCRQTALGQEADRKRWFPILDDAEPPPR